jgi:hypothetical protein
MSISLLGSINVCKVNTGWADKIQSDRFENPSNLLCPLWNGQDNFGRFVHPDSFVTKNAGCNSADDRVRVENFLRPQYMEYVALDAAGFQAPLYGDSRPVVEGFENPNNMNMFTSDAMATRQNNRDDIYRVVGSAGFDYSQTNTLYDTGLRGVNGDPYSTAGCGRRYNPNPVVENFSYDNRANNNYDQRVALSQINGYQHNIAMQNSGFYPHARTMENFSAAPRR